jgi:hypothetical protein
MTKRKRNLGSPAIEHAKEAKITAEQAGSAARLAIRNLTFKPMDCEAAERQIRGMEHYSGMSLHAQDSASELRDHLDPAHDWPAAWERTTADMIKARKLFSSRCRIVPR